jgi:SWI/SNF-related matrix-associated actin-dependent regulator of chromatin subfamily A-like protein 1
MKQLLPHQIADAAFLASKSFAGNFSGMGSGKTLTALEAVRLVDPTTTYRTIIVGPPISLSMWAEEFEAHMGEEAQIVRSAKVNLDTLAPALIMSYQIATKRRDELRALGAKVLICDESHALKNSTAKRTKAIIGKHGICESVEHTWCLTGTPSTRWNDDLFTFMSRANPEALTAQIGKLDMSRFRLRYCVTQKKVYSPAQRFPAEITVGNRNTAELNDMLFDGMAVRRELAEVWAAMPPLTINRLDVELEMDPELREMIKAMDKKTMNEIREDIGKKEEHISTMRRKLGVAKVKHSVSEIVDRVQAGILPILVGAIHHDVIDALDAALQGAGLDVGVIDGRTGPMNRDIMVLGFNTGMVDVLIGQVHAMGVALNMQGGSHIICVEEDWSPAIMDQFYARCHRIGQANHVHVDIFQSNTKLDQAVRRISTAKARGHNNLMDQGEDA